MLSKMAEQVFAGEKLTELHTDMHATFVPRYRTYFYTDMHDTFGPRYRTYLYTPPLAHV